MTASLSGLTEALDAAQKDAAAGATRAMGRAGDGLKSTLRDQIVSAGFSDKLAKTWQNKVYPQRRDSLAPAAFVWSKAPNIVDAYARGVTIVATGGRRFLAIPTDAVPRAKGGKGMTPQQVESRFGRKLRLVPAKGPKAAGPAQGAVAYLVLDNTVVSKASGRARNAGPRAKKPQATVMFELVSAVKVPKKLDLQGALNSAAAALPQLLAEEWGQ